MVATLSSTNSLFSDESIFRTGVAEPLPTKLEGDDMSALTVPQLVNAQRPRGRDAIWIRREASAGILAADPLD
jgi:hypothetical protein